MEDEARKVDWEQVKRCIAHIDKTSKEFLYQALLIGGSAVWFYRNQLSLAKDPDFPVPPTNQEERARWLSRDLDFTGILSRDAFMLLPSNVVLSEDGKKHLQIEGVRIGFAQAGVMLNPEEAFEFARPARFRHEGRDIEFLVADPLTLYFEKLVLSSKRGYPNDSLHAKLLFEYVAYELVKGAENNLKQIASVYEAQATLSFWMRVKRKAPEFLQDPRVIARLSPLLAGKSHHPFAEYLANAR